MVSQEKLFKRIGRKGVREREGRREEAEVEGKEGDKGSEKKIRTIMKMTKMGMKVLIRGKKMKETMF